jgi:hypothetical protein
MRFFGITGFYRESRIPVLFIRTYNMTLDGMFADFARNGRVSDESYYSFSILRRY